MRVVSDTVKKFGELIGVDGLALDEKGRLSFSIEKQGAVAIEAREGYVLLYLRRELNYPTMKTYQQALKLCHMDQEHERVLNVALVKDKYLIFCLRFDENDFILTELESGIELLGSLHDQVS